MADILISLFRNKNGVAEGNLSLDDYVGFIRSGYNQDDVIQGRMFKGRGDLESYKKIKNQTKAVTLSCQIKEGKTHGASNIVGLTGYICIDIDEVPTPEQIAGLRTDEYTHVMHRSFGEDGIAIIVKINPERFDHSYMGLSEYYFNRYGVIVDPACKNRNRLRYISYDPDIYVNHKSKQYNPKDVKRFKEPKPSNYVFHQDSFDDILKQIGEKRIDLAQDDYHRWVRIGMSLASHFGLDGLDKFLFVSSMGMKYKEEDARKHYLGFCKRTQGQSQISTFFYFCKEAGITIYNKKGETIVKRVTIGKAQGNPSLDSIASNLRAANDIEINEGDQEFINELLEGGANLNKEVQGDLKNIEVLREFIKEVYDPYLDLISKKRYLKDKELKPKEFEELYLTCVARMDFPVNRGDVRSIMNSYTVREVNALQTFFEENNGVDSTGHIEAIVRSIEPYSEYNLWAFKKWLVGMVHNWVNFQNPRADVSPLTLILVGGQGSGKTHFFRHLLPPSLSGYMIESKLANADKDSVFRLCSCLMFNMNDFGAQTFKDAAEFKSLSDSKDIVQRRPYMETDETFLRVAGLCGSSNEIDILKDHTGNRRLLPIKVDRIIHTKVNEVDRVGLILEAYKLYQNGFIWQLYTDKDQAYLDENTLDNKIEMPVEDIFLETFRFDEEPGFEKETFWSQGALLRHLNQDNTFTINKFDLKDVLVKHKAKNETTTRNGKTVRGYRLFMRDLRF